MSQDCFGIFNISHVQGLIFQVSDVPKLIFSRFLKLQSYRIVIWWSRICFFFFIFYVPGLALNSYLYVQISWMDDRREKSRFLNCKMLGLRQTNTSAEKNYSLGNPEWFIPVPDPASTFKEFRIRPQLFLKGWFF